LTHIQKVAKRYQLSSQDSHYTDFLAA
jgi:hypothetical protein